VGWRRSEATRDGAKGESQMTVAAIFVAMASLLHPLLAEQPKRFLEPEFEIAVAMSPSLEPSLPKDAIADDLELILRRAGFGVATKKGQVLQLTIDAALSDDKREMAVNVKLEALAIGFTLKIVVACSGKRWDDECWGTTARRISVWEQNRLLAFGQQQWQPESVRKAIKELASSFVVAAQK
jgi:hypothetical protein